MRMLLPHPRVAGQVWVHSCCSLARLELALASREVTAIETDIIMASGVPIMAHPPARSSDLTFERFLDLVLADGAKHLKLDFKVFEAVEPCLLMLAEVEERIRRNEQVGCPAGHADCTADPRPYNTCSALVPPTQAVWLNADVVAGPNHRRSRIKIPAANFLPLCRRLCPFALLSLGWVVAPIGPEEAYTSDDARRMARICLDHGIPGHQVRSAPAASHAALRSVCYVPLSLLLVSKASPPPPPAHPALGRSGCIFSSVALRRAGREPDHIAAAPASRLSADPLDGDWRGAGARLDCRRDALRAE